MLFEFVLKLCPAIDLKENREALAIRYPLKQKPDIRGHLTGAGLKQRKVRPAAAPAIRGDQKSRQESMMYNVAVTNVCHLMWSKIPATWQAKLLRHILPATGSECIIREGVHHGKPFINFFFRSGKAIRATHKGIITNREFCAFLRSEGSRRPGLRGAGRRPAMKLGSRS